jgi:solute carrier family 35 (UDP-galactose transporter), member B1
MGKGAGKGGNSHEDHEDGDYSKMDNYYFWLAFCSLGMISSLTLYGITLEYATSGGRKLHEISFVFVTCSIYSITAYCCREYFQENRTEISKYQMLTLSCTSIASTISSVRSLRYVIYPVQVLFKSCKPVPVMIFGTILGKKYPLKKFVNVIIITCGVALFMGAGTSTSKKGVEAEMGGGGLGTALIGGLLLTFSLCFDGATGAYEDKLIAVNNVEPFDLMFNIQLGKSFLAFIALIITNNIGSFVTTLSDGGMMLVVLGLTGALGQVFVFVTISKFGALNSALIGLIRKILSLVLSFILYGHTMNAMQTIGLALSITSMIANFYDKGGGKKKSDVVGGDGDGAALSLEAGMGSGERGTLTDSEAMDIAMSNMASENKGLMDNDDDDDDDDEGGNEEQYGCSNNQQKQRSQRSPVHAALRSGPQTGRTKYIIHNKNNNSDPFLNVKSDADTNINASGSGSGSESVTNDIDEFDVHISVDRVTPSKGQVNGNINIGDDIFELNASHLSVTSGNDSDNGYNDHDDNDSSSLSDIQVTIDHITPTK